MSDDAPFHAHIYYVPQTRPLALALQSRFQAAKAAGEVTDLLFIGELRDHKVGPHRLPQFEIHFPHSTLAQLRPMLEGAGLTVLIHPLTLDDMADHTTLGDWIGEPLDLDLSVLDPPGINQGFARFGKTDF